MIEKCGRNKWNTGTGIGHLLNYDILMDLLNAFPIRNREWHFAGCSVLSECICRSIASIHLINYSNYGTDFNAYWINYIDFWFGLNTGFALPANSVWIRFFFNSPFRTWITVMNNIALHFTTRIIGTPREKNDGKKRDSSEPCCCMNVHSGFHCFSNEFEWI